MSDTNDNMTLREAVEIVECGRYQFALDAECAISDDAPPRLSKKKAAREAFAKWDRARAIVDAAVEAHEARCKAEETDPRKLDAMPLHELEALGAEYESTFRKLRALERGESKVQP